MGDRAEIAVRSDDETVYLYSHWDGNSLINVLRAALVRGKSRWDDPPYLTRIIFCEMVKDEISGLEGYGIWSSHQESEHGLYLVDINNQKVDINGSVFSFQEFISLPIERTEELKKDETYA